MRSYFAQVRFLLAQALRADWQDKERLLSPLLFALVMLLLVNFAFAGFPALLPGHLYVAQTYLTLLFSMQLVLARLFAPETQDGAFELLRSSLRDPSAYFVAKCLQSCLLGLLLLAPTLLLGAIFLGEAPLRLPLFLALAVGVILGLSALGVLLGLLTLHSRGRELLLPLLFYPLAVPVLLAGLEGSLGLLELAANAPLTANLRSWFGLLLCFDVIYATLGYLFFTELLDEH